MGFQEGNIQVQIITFIVASWLFIVAFGLSKKVNCEGLLIRGELKYFETSNSLSQ